MPKFFRRAGTSRGVFPDGPVPEDESLFTNFDQCLTFCSVADGVIIPPPPTCSPANPFVSEVTQEDFD
jgi:hypothetical protein